MIRRESSFTSGLIQGREPTSNPEYNLDYFNGGFRDGLAYPREKDYLNPDSEYRHKFLDIIDLVRKYTPQGNLLDVAAGPGHIGTWIKRKKLPYNVVNVDISNQVLSWAKNEHNISNPVTADLRDLPFKNASFDGILLLDILEHIWPAEAEEVVKHAHQLLKPDGRVFIMIPNRVTWDSKPRQYQSHVWLPTVREMNTLLEAAGFRPDSTHYFTRGFPFSNYWRNMTGRDLRAPLFGRSIFITAKK